MKQNRKFWFLSAFLSAAFTATAFLTVAALTFFTKTLAVPSVFVVAGITALPFAGIVAAIALTIALCVMLGASIARKTSPMANAASEPTVFSVDPLHALAGDAPANNAPPPSTQRAKVFNLPPPPPAAAQPRAAHQGGQLPLNGGRKLGRH